MQKDPPISDQTGTTNPNNSKIKKIEMIRIVDNEKVKNKIKKQPNRRKIIIIKILRIRNYIYAYLFVIIIVIIDGVHHFFDAIDPTRLRLKKQFREREKSLRLPC